MEGFDVRSAVLPGDAGTVVWDTLAHPDQMAPARALVRARPSTVVYSHADWDHAWGTCGLADVEEVVAHEASLARFKSDVPEELARRRASDGPVWDAVRLIAPTRTFAASLTLEMGSTTLELHALAGHTPDSIVGFVPDWGVLLAGDAVETPLPVVNDPRSVGGWISGLEAWMADSRVKVVVPSHGPVGGPELLDRTAAYLRALVQGRRARPAADLSPFYRETHEANVRLLSERG